MMKRHTLTVLCLMACVSQAFCQSLKLATANKKDTEVNPILPYNLCADPTAVEYKGRLYVYGTNDQQELNTTKNTTKNTYGKITQLVCMSSADLVNWTYHGPIDVKAASSWIATSWAPSIVSREEKDGKTHFYLYYTNTASGIGVLTATSPTGPWRDPLGHALIDGRTPGRGLQSNIIDPGVCIDDEGNGWLTFGGGDPNSSGTKLQPGNARIVKLGSNMISLSGEIKPIPAPFHFEANELNFINGKFVFSYSGGWSCNSGDWSKYEGRGSFACPGNCSILMMQTDDPINGEWKYTGEMLKNPGSFGYPWGNNHSHMQKFGDQWYMLYHTQYLEGKMGISGGYRGIAISKVTVNESSVKITAPTMNNTGPALLSANRLKLADKVEAETMANGAGISVAKSGTSVTLLTDIEAGDWTMLRSVNVPEEIKSITARIKGTGTLEIRPGKITAAPIAKLEFNNSSLKVITADLETPIPGDKTHTYLYLVFTEASKGTQVDYYKFNPCLADEMTPIADVDEDGGDDVVVFYSMDGKRLSERPARGAYIRSKVMRDGSRSSEKHVR